MAIACSHVGCTGFYINLLTPRVIAQHGAQDAVVDDGQNSRFRLAVAFDHDGLGTLQRRSDTTHFIPGRSTPRDPRYLGSAPALTP
jgi:hypothetical protein